MDNNDTMQPLFSPGLYAFPSTLVVNNGHTVRWAACTGMTLRDYIAMQVLTGQMAYGGVEGIDAKHIAAMCYEMADAMLEARTTKKE